MKKSLRGLNEKYKKRYIFNCRIYPQSRTDGSSNYRVLVSDDGLNWTQIVEWISNPHSTTPFGTIREHLVSIPNRFVRIELTRNGSWGCMLSEIEFYAR